MFVCVFCGDRSAYSSEMWKNITEIPGGLGITAVSYGVIDKRCSFCNLIARLSGAIWGVKQNKASARIDVTEWRRPLVSLLYFPPLCCTILLLPDGLWDIQKGSVCECRSGERNFTVYSSTMSNPNKEHLSSRLKRRWKDLPLHNALSATGYFLCRESGFVDFCHWISKLLDLGNIHDD